MKSGKDEKTDRYIIIILHFFIEFYATIGLVMFCFRWMAWRMYNNVILRFAFIGPWWSHHNM